MALKMHDLLKPKAQKFKGKVVMLGDSGVGKTSILLRFDGQGFTSCMSPTLTASFLSAKIRLEDAEVELSIWDTAGQERFRSMLPMYTRNAVAAIFVYDMTRYDSFRHLDQWFNEMTRNVPSRLVYIVMANKSDLATARVVSESEGREYAASKGALYVETSALNGRGIELGVREIAEQLLECHRLDSANSETSVAPSEQTSRPTPPKDEKKPRASTRSCCSIS
ncbi:Ras family protein [Aphelenchoides fujianensis]|nr:Ras family protein [Aphelenchoides fujianensis]